MTTARNGRAASKRKPAGQEVVTLGFPSSNKLILKIMFKGISEFLGVLLLLLILRWLLPSEVGQLASEILVKILTIIRDLLLQLPNP